MRDIIITEADGRYSIAEPITLEDLVGFVQATLNKRLLRENIFTSPQTVIHYLISLFATKEREEFYCLYLDSQHRLMQYEVLAIGTINQASVYPREVIKKGLEVNAAALIVAHNHPSGCTEPSSADKLLTQDIQKACRLMQIRLLDHIVIAGGKSYSFAEHGLI